MNIIKFNSISYNESESKKNLYEEADEYANDNEVEEVVYHDEVIPEFLIEITWSIECSNFRC